MAAVFNHLEVPCEALLSLSYWAQQTCMRSAMTSPSISGLSTRTRTCGYRWAASREGTSESTASRELASHVERLSQGPPENWQAMCKASAHCKQMASTCKEEGKPQTALDRSSLLGHPPKPTEAHEATDPIKLGPRDLKAGPPKL